MRSRSLIIGLVLALAPMGILASRFLMHHTVSATEVSPQRVDDQRPSRAQGGVELTGVTPLSGD